MFIDNHDIISLKLYQLTVLRSQKEEEEEEEEITIPSVDNIELLRCKTHTHTLAVYSTLPTFYSLFNSLTVVLSASGSDGRRDEWHCHLLHRALLHAGLYLPHRHRPGGLQQLERDPAQALLLKVEEADRRRS